MAGMIVPPGGFAGFAQMTPASKSALGGRTNGARSSGRRRRKTKKASSRRSTSSRKTKGRLPKFGSPAWRKKFKLGKKR